MVYRPPQLRKFIAGLLRRVKEILNPPRRLLWVIVALVVVLAVCVVRYVATEEWSFLDAFYMTRTTLSTVGYREVHPLCTGC